MYTVQGGTQEARLACVMKLIPLPVLLHRSL